MDYIIMQLGNNAILAGTHSTVIRTAPMLNAEMDISTRLLARFVKIITNVWRPKYVWDVNACKECHHVKESVSHQPCHHDNSGLQRSRR